MLRGRPVRKQRSEHPVRKKPGWGQQLGRYTVATLWWRRCGGSQHKTAVLRCMQVNFAVEGTRRIWQSGWLRTWREMSKRSLSKGFEIPVFKKKHGKCRERWKGLSIGQARA